MRSNVIKKGLDKAPHRSLLKALGYVEEELERPLIGVVNSYNEIVPGHLHLERDNSLCQSRRPVGRWNSGRISCHCCL